MKRFFGIDRFVFRETYSTFFDFKYLTFLSEIVDDESKYVAGKMNFQLFFLDEQDILCVQEGEGSGEDR